MGESTEQLTHDIEQTRGQLGSHLDELQDKVSPSAIATRQKEAAKSRVLGVRDKVMGSARDAGDSVGAMGSSVSGTASDAAGTAKDQFQGAPLAAGLAAFGLGMVAAALIPASKAESRAAVQLRDTVQDQAQPLLDDAKQAAADMGAQLKDSAADSAQQVKETGAEAVAHVQDEGQASVQAVRSDAGS